MSRNKRLADRREPQRLNWPPVEDEFSAEVMDLGRPGGEGLTKSLAAQPPWPPTRLPPPAESGEKPRRAAAAETSRSRLPVAVRRWRAAAAGWLGSRTRASVGWGLGVLVVTALALVWYSQVGSGVATITAGGAGLTPTLPPPPAPAEAEPPARPPTLRVETDRPGAEVSIDGRSFGKTPVTAGALGVGEHLVVVKAGAATVRQTVRLEEGTMTALVVPVVAVSPPASSRGATTDSGWVEVRSPMKLSVLEQGQPVIAEGGRISLSTGSHTLVFRDEELGYEHTHSVTVEPGKTIRIQIPAPPGRLHVNAVPWAEVWVDGRRVGETPLANLELPAGKHDVLLRHPTLGERRQQVTITARGPARVGVDMRK